MKKGEKRFSLMGLKCSRYRNDEGRWVIAASLSDLELFNKYLVNLLGDDVIGFSSTDTRVHAETRFTNIEHLRKKLRQPKSIES